MLHFQEIKKHMHIGLWVYYSMRYDICFINFYERISCIFFSKEQIRLVFKSNQGNKDFSRNQKNDI